jgi:hypothetical protein
MAIYSVKVEFIVEAEPMGPWAGEQCACDYVRHKIDEGYRMEAVRDWSFLSVIQIPEHEPQP